MFHADSPDLYPGTRNATIETDADVRIAAQRRPHLGSEEKRGRRKDPREETETFADPGRRPRLLPRTPLPGLRESRAARRGVARRQRTLRRRLRGQRDRSGRIPRLLDRNQPPRRTDDPRTLRQPVPDVRKDHRRQSLQRTDDDLSGRALYDGRYLGGLQLDDHDPRPVCDRRGQLLRPRREPSGRIGADAGFGRRLFRTAVYDRRLPLARNSDSENKDRPARIRGSRKRRPRKDRQVAVDPG